VGKGGALGSVYCHTGNVSAITRSESVTESLSPAEIARYARQMALPEVGNEGQERLKRARVVVIGAGGLGSPVASYLAAAGVGTLGIVDSDAVDLSNLHRQLLYVTSDIGSRKVASASSRLRALNPNVKVVPFDAELTRKNAMEILQGFDLVVDGTDNFRTRYLVNDACVLLGIPNVYGSVLRFDGQVTVLAAPNGEGPCYRCLYPVPPPPGSVPSCAEAGVLSVLPGIVGMLQATEAIKLILGKGEALVGRLLLIDALAARFTNVAIRRDPQCVACGTRTLRELVDYDEFCAPQNAQNGSQQGVTQITARELDAWRTDRKSLALVDVREPWEWNLGHISGATLLPLGALARSVASLDPSVETVVYCHLGTRSQAAAERLVALGFRRVYNLAGGIDAWSSDVDPGIPRY
jgi:molybdopterin/thiamine biosynthesis adenylyltransferase/rhodanese-related sulfurtransferase